MIEEKEVEGAARGSGPCPHYDLRNATFSDPLPAGPPRVYQIIISRPEDCPTCALARIKTIRDSLNDILSVAAELMHRPSNLVDRAALTARMTAAVEVLHNDMRMWWRP